MNGISDKKRWYALLPVLLLGLLPVKGNAGIMIGGTRFIYNEKNQNGISFLVRNTDDTPFLIQTQIIADQSKGNEGVKVATVPGARDFVATPPLLPLRKKQENYVRIIRTGGDLPTDRESLFQVSVAAIPSGKPGSNDLQVAIRSRYKLIYRPSGLKGNPNEVYQQLRWQRHGASVTVENPTPYYVTLFKMVINGKLQPAMGVVVPFGSRTDSWCPPNGGCSLKWQSLNDMGIPTSPWVITPTGVANLGKAITTTSAAIEPKKPDEKRSEAHSSPRLP